MISSKFINKAGVILISLTVILCFLAMIFSEQLVEIFGDVVYSVEYENKLFDTGQVANINIIMDEDEWTEMLDNATSEEYYQCNVEINGETFYNVGIRPKGNTSLSSIARDSENDRYSFKLEFDKFVDGQSCWGLDKLVLNNSYADITNMKEAIIYDMFQYLDADASLYNYTKISVNGNYWGVYLALEAVEDSFMTRNYGMQKGFLYKPDGMNMGGRDGEQKGNPGEGEGRRGFEFSEEQMEEFKKMFGNDEQFEEMQKLAEEGNFDEIRKMAEKENPFEGERENRRGGFGGGPGGGGPGGMGGGNGANLNYIDDELDSYSTIWNGAVTGSSEADHKRVVEAIKNVNAGTEPEKYLDIDNVLKYMAVHCFSVNDDSLSGSMAHNYYLYESGGKLNILPWDYNLAFGGMHSSDSSSVINDPIDMPFDSTEFFNALLENEEYKAKYYEYYNKLVEEYVFGGKFDETYQRIRNQIDELVKDDPNAMYSYEEYLEGADMFYDTVRLRAESIRGQVNGTIPSTREEQSADSSKLIDSSSIDTSKMGQFMGGGPGDRNRQGNNNSVAEKPEGTETAGQNTEVVE